MSEHIESKVHHINELGLNRQKILDEEMSNLAGRSDISKVAEVSAPVIIKDPTR
jgi:hypothetical protein